MTRTTIDSLFDLMEKASIGMNSVPGALSKVNVGFPPYNIAKLDEDNYRLELAVAGYNREDLTVSYDNNLLTIEGHREDDDVDYVYKGISGRKFTKQFPVANNINISEVALEDGILYVYFHKQQEVKGITFDIK